MYNIILFVHVLAAMLWIGGTTTLQVLALRAKGSGDGERLHRMSKEAEWIGTRVLTPISIVLLLAGTTMAVIGPYGFGQPFVIVGLFGYACSIAGGITLGAIGKRMEKAIEDHGVEHADVRTWVSRIATVGRIELLVLVTVVFFMIVKPGTVGGMA
jgi:uncharacterized membrane protein